MNRHTRHTTVAIGAALALVVSATASTAATPNPRVLHIVSRTLVQSGPSTQPVPGDRYAFYDSDTGSDHGHDYQDCVLTNPHGDVLCTGEFTLKHGELSVVYVTNDSQPNLHGTGTITGGTGRYSRTRGKVTVTGTVALTRFAFHVVP